VATKFGHRYHGHHQRSDEWSPAEVVRQLDRSLRALQTDYVDLYQFHSGDDAAFDRDDLWEALAMQVVAGKVRYLGISLGSHSNVHQVEQAVAVGASVIQLVYSRLDVEPEAEILPWCQNHGLGVLAREALAGGVLTGKYRPGHRFTDPADTRSSRSAGEMEERLREADRIRQEEVPEGVPMAGWALAWCLAHPAVTSVLPGCKSVDQLEASVTAADLQVMRPA
jgi:aryl-alcohol dehydrogenase-like predicted oxidoreductase